jgi:hypothetical protein
MKAVHFRGHVTNATSLLSAAGFRAPTPQLHCLAVAGAGTYPT